jgi:hypothetical protein
VRLLDGQRPGGHRHQQHRLDVQRVGQADQVLGPVDVHLTFLPTNGARVFESQNVGEVPLARIGTTQLAQTLHTKLPELF